MIGPERGITSLLTWGEPHPGYAQAGVAQGCVTLGRGAACIGYHLPTRLGNSLLDILRL